MSSAIAHLGRLACLFRRPAVSTLASPSVRWFPSLAIDRCGRTGRYAGIEYDACLMPVRYQQRQEQLSPVRYLSARHRRCELRYSQEYRKTFKHRIVFYFDRALGAAVLNEAGQVPQGDRRQQGSSSLICPRIDLQLRDEQIGRGPRKSYDSPESQPYQYPGNSLSPEHASYPARLTAVRAVLRNNRHRTSTECNIRCCLSLA